MKLTDKIEKRIIGDKRKEVIIVVKPLTKTEAREMYPYRPYNKYSESRFGIGNGMVDDIALLLNGNAKRCKMCAAPIRKEYLISNICPDCDGRSEYNGTDPRSTNYFINLV